MRKAGCRAYENLSLPETIKTEFYVPAKGLRSKLLVLFLSFQAAVKEFLFFHFTADTGILSSVYIIINRRVIKYSNYSLRTGAKSLS